MCGGGLFLVRFNGNNEAGNSQTQLVLEWRATAYPELAAQVGRVSQRRWPGCRATVRGPPRALLSSLGAEVLRITEIYDLMLIIRNFELAIKELEEEVLEPALVNVQD